VPRLDNVYLVFYTLLLEPFTKRSVILYLDIPITNTLRSYSNNIYKVNELLNRR
jgi:hypothetical protein